MRVGLNPYRFKEVPAHFPDVLLTVITHLPHTEGYHAQRFEIVQECLETMRAGADGAPVMVWDNGSCDLLRDWLTAHYKPEYLILSPNIGKDSARAALVKMLPPGTIVSYSDDDMQFRAGWLAAHLELLRGFPNVGMVSGYPVRASFAWGKEKMLAWAEKHGKVEKGYFIPDEWVRDYIISVGGKVDEATLKHHWDYRITYNGRAAYATAQHCQFVGYAGKLAPFLNYSALGSGDEHPLDNAIDAAGLLRLTTLERYARHMGNVRD